MIKEIKMPAGGQTTDTSTIGTWFVKKGDQVNRGDGLLEIETDKATLTVESFAKGMVLATLAETGDVASAGDVIAYVGDESDLPEVERRLSGGAERDVLAADAAAGSMAAEGVAAQDSGAAEEEEYQPIDKRVPRILKGQAPEVPADSIQMDAAKTAASNVKAMPNAKMMAKEQGVDLGAVAAYTGKEFLKRADVKAYLDSGAGRKDMAAAGGARDTHVPLTAMRKVIARRMLESTQNIPVFTASIEVNMEQCIALRALVNQKGDGKKISYNDLLFKLIEKAVVKYPYINASFSETEIILHGAVNIGLAISLDQGLVVPVVQDVQNKTVAEISAANKVNIEKARNGGLKPADMSGGTITLSNLGMYPVTQFHAIINPPEVCILAIGAMYDKPVLANGQWQSVKMMTITGSFDHRVIDGAYGAQFLSELKLLAENPALALL